MVVLFRRGRRPFGFATFKSPLRLREQITRIQKHDSVLVEQLDVVGRYRWRGLGHNLIDPTGDDAFPFDNAVEIRTAEKAAPRLNSTSFRRELYYEIAEPLPLSQLKNTRLPVGIKVCVKRCLR